MGAWGGLCVFDHTRFLSDVAPALRAGESHPLVRRALARRAQTRLLQSSFRGLAKVMAHGDPDLTTCALGQDFVVCDGALVTAPTRTEGCLDRWSYEDLADLFERIVTREAVLAFVVLGLTFDTVRRLLPEDVLADPRARALVRQLDDRCVYWAAGTGGYGEGIRGWLDPQETFCLAEALRGGGSDDDPLAERVRGYCAASGDDPDVHLWRLGQFRDVLTRAIDGHQGVLWGRDLLLFHDAPGLFGRDEARPQAL